MSTKAFDLKASYSQLNRACGAQDYDKVTKLSTKILANRPTEVKALLCKLVALIRQGKYDDVLGSIKKFPALAKHCAFEKAYAEYRLNRISEALRTIADTDQSDMRIMELKSQLDDYGEERLSNLLALSASAKCFSSQKLEPVEEDINSKLHEAKYNMACYLIGLGKLEEAHALLLDAEGKKSFVTILIALETCRQTLTAEGEVSEEELNEELAPIFVQRAYILQCQSKEEEANQLYQAVLKQKSVDPALLAVAANNVLCINRDQHVFDSRKRVKTAAIDGVVAHKLFKGQQQDILFNQALFYWHTGQTDLCQTKLTSLSQLTANSGNALASSTSIRSALLSALQLVKEKKTDKAVQLLRGLIDDMYQSSFDGDYGNQQHMTLVLALAQLTLPPGKSRAESPAAAAALDQLLAELLPPINLYRIGIVATRIALASSSSASDDDQSTGQLINQLALRAVEYWTNTTRDGYDDQMPGQIVDNDALFQIIDHTSALLLSSRLNEPRLVTQLINFYLSTSTASSIDPSQRQLLTSRLVQAYARFDLNQAESVCKSLPSIDSNATALSDADVDALETNFLYGAKALKRHGKKTAEQPVASEQIEDVEATTKRKQHHKKRKIRLPKNYQPGQLPDPERWLPRRERQQYRGKRRDKRHNTNVRGPQGQVVGGTELDASLRSPKPSSPQTETSSATANTPRQHYTPKPHHRKGRKKGR